MKLKMSLIFVFLLTISSVINAQNWVKSWDEAKSSAQTEHKNILLNFSGSDWCISCIKMHKNIFDSPEFVKFSKDNLVLYDADFPRNKKNQLPQEIQNVNNELAEKYDEQGHFPMTLLLSPDLKVLKVWDGNYAKGVDDFLNEIK